MTASVWGDVASALIEVFGGVSDVPVFDGLPVTHESLPGGVAVGIDPASDEGMAGESRQEWRDAGPAPEAARKESGEVLCAAWAVSGDDDMAGVRSRAFGSLSLCMDEAHKITSLGLGPLTSVGLSRLMVIQRRTSAGVICEVQFKVSYEAIIY